MRQSPASKKTKLNHSAASNHHYSIESLQYTLHLTNRECEENNAIPGQLTTSSQSILIYHAGHPEQRYQPGRVLGQGSFGTVTDLIPCQKDLSHYAASYELETPLTPGDYVIKQPRHQQNYSIRLQNQTTALFKRNHSTHLSSEVLLEIQHALNEQLHKANIPELIEENSKSEHERMWCAFSKEAETNRLYHQGTPKAEAVRLLQGKPYLAINYNLKTQIAKIEYRPAIILIMAKEPGATLFQTLPQEISCNLSFLQLLCNFLWLGTEFESLDSKGIVHCDASPSNLILNRNKKKITAVDFGWEKFPPEEGGTQQRVKVIDSRNPNKYHRPNRFKLNNPYEEYTEIGGVDDAYTLTQIIIEMLVLYQNKNQGRLSQQISSEMLTYYLSLLSQLETAPANASGSLPPIMIALHLFHMVALLKQYHHENGMVTKIYEMKQYACKTLYNYTGSFKNSLDVLSEVIDVIDRVKKAHDHTNPPRAIEHISMHQKPEQRKSTDKETSPISKEPQRPTIFPMTLPEKAPLLYRAKSDQKPDENNSMLSNIPNPLINRALSH